MKLWIRVESLFITELSVVVKTKVKTQDLRPENWKPIFHLFFYGNERGTEAEKGRAKNYLENPKKPRSESISFRKNRFWNVCQIEKTISNPGLINWLTNNNPRIFSNSRKFSQIEKNILSLDTCASSQHFVTIQHIVSRWITLGRLGVKTRTD